MLTVTRRASAGRRGVSRRNFLQIGLLGPLGMAWPAATRTAQAAPSSSVPSFGRAKRCILVFLNGGPSQLDLWDMKPHAPAEVRGELSPIATNVSGIQVSELLPQMARHADKYKIVRTVTHDAPVHTTAVYTMLTGTYHLTPAVDQTRATPQDAPHLGSVYSLARGRQRRGLPFVSLPTLFRAAPVEGVWPGQTAGFLGHRYDPLVLEGDKQTAKFRFPEIELPGEMTAERLQNRRGLLAHFDQLRREGFDERSAQGKNAVYQQAWSLLDSPALRRAADLEQEPPHVRQRYGNHLFGQGLLLARRLIEADVPLVTVYWIDPTPAGAGGGEYDSHGRIYWHMRNRLLPPSDRALSALFADLWERGLQDDTLVVVMSEFGRTPKINKDAGRDHWPSAQSILLAGAGVSGGTIHGATDKWAANPVADPVTPPNLAQSIFHLLGVPAHLEAPDAQGRLLRVNEGQVDHKLIS